MTLLEEQTHWDTGAGLQFIRLIQVALSVLNRSASPAAALLGIVFACSIVWSVVLRILMDVIHGYPTILHILQ